ncbi:MAG: alpha/beta fold hydrolase [Dehalococcoidia bacterium]|nr:alpha/beta fold hydrolase [Dehalococcoidia bacterium]
MPSATVHGLVYDYEEKGSGLPIVFAHGLTFDRHMWDHQVETLSSRYRCIAYDFLGHGGSPVGPEGYSLEDEAENLHALMAQWGASPAHVVGLSMGGMVALRLALAHPQDVRSLTILDASAEEELPERRPLYEQLAATAKAQGPQTVADPVAGFMFSRGFVQSQPEKVEAYKRGFEGMDMEGLERATQAVTRRTNVLDRIPQITVPALVLVGSEDIATTPDKAQRIAEGIPGARLETVAGSGHMTPVEQPERISDLLSAFLAQVGGGGPK